MKRLIITDYDADNVLIKCSAGGMVQDTRTGKTYSEVICGKQQVKWYKAY